MKCAKIPASELGNTWLAEDHVPGVKIQRMLLAIDLERKRINSSLLRIEKYTQAIKERNRIVSEKTP